MAHTWSISDMPDMSGKTAVITGGNTGLGFKTALELVRRGAHVVIGSRSTANGEQAVARIRADIPDAKIGFCQLELTDDTSVTDFANAYMDTHDRLDILLHNAGLVIHPKYEQTAAGRELQMHINHLGHYALTCQLMPVFLATQGARLVQSTTVPYNKGNIDFDDFDWTQRKYSPMQSYFDSRLAQILFAFSLNQEFKRQGHNARAISMQPGLVATEGLQNSDFGGWIMKALARPLETGCRTHLRTCTDPDIDAERFWEPKFIIGGASTPKPFKPQARDVETAKRLMQKSADLTNLAPFTQ